MSTSDVGQSRYEAVVFAGGRAVLWEADGRRNLLGFIQDETLLEGARNRHRNEARGLAAAEIAEREKTTFGFYADEVLRANLWPSHLDEPEEAAEQLDKVRAALAAALMQADPFRAAVSFESGLGTSCDVRLVRLFEDTIPFVDEAASSNRLLDLAAAALEDQLVAGSPMARSARDRLCPPEPQENGAPRP